MRKRKTPTTYAVLDTETTGLFDFSKPADAEGQPRLCNLAIITLHDDLGTDVEVNLFARPDGWTVPKESTAIHGLTDDILMDRGIPVTHLLDAYEAVLQDGYTIASFNSQYDTKVLRGELRRAGRQDRFTETPNICIMRALTGVCKIPKKSGPGYKFPSLWEACKHFKIEQPDEHTALGDARMSVELLRWLDRLGLMPEAKVHYAKRRP